MAYDGDLKIDEDNDLVVESGDLVVVRGKDSIESDLHARLSSYRNEWFLDLNAGVPYFEHFFIKNPSPATMRAYLLKEAQETPGVTEMKTFSLDLSALRKLSVAFKANTDVGELVEGEVAL